MCTTGGLVIRVFDPLDLLAEVTQHTANRGEHQV
jgi:hypothetical protein